MGEQPLHTYRPISNIELPCENSRGDTVESFGWMTHYPLISNGLAFESNNGGAYGRIYQGGYFTPEGVYARDGLFRAERGGVVDLIVDEQGRFGLQLRDRPQTNKSHEDYAADFDAGILDWNSLGRLGWEAPRGYGDKFKKLAETARCEAEEETGLKVLSQEHTMWFCDNTANTVHFTGVFKTELDLCTPSGAEDQDHEKALSGLVFYDSAQILSLIDECDLYDAMFLAAIAKELLQRDVSQTEFIATLSEKLGECGKEIATLRDELRKLRARSAE